jgi:Predicted transcriptional regulators
LKAVRGKTLIGAMSHPVRKQIIEILSRSPETVNNIVTIIGKSQPEISSHMAILAEAGVVESYPFGREKLYKLIPEEFEELSTWIDGILHPENRKDPPHDMVMTHTMKELHYARTCYDHLAGVQGVEMLDILFAKGWVKREENRNKRLTLTDDGVDALHMLEVKIPARKNSRRMFAYLCMDWTVKKYHLGGALGLSLLNALERKGYVEKVPNSRKVNVIRQVRFFFAGESSSPDYEKQ